MSQYLCQLLSECMDLSMPKAQQVLDILQKVEIVDAEDVDRWERNAKIYHTRADVTTAVLVQRFPLTRSMIFEVIKAHRRRLAAVSSLKNVA